MPYDCKEVVTDILGKIKFSIDFQKRTIQVIVEVWTQSSSILYERVRYPKTIKINKRIEQKMEWLLPQNDQKKKKNAGNSDKETKQVEQNSKLHEETGLGPCNRGLNHKNLHQPTPISKISWEEGPLGQNCLGRFSQTTGFAYFTGPKLSWKIFPNYRFCIFAEPQSTQQPAP